MERQERRVLAILAAIFAIVFVLVYGFVYGPTHLAIWRYEPVEGDIIFQSIPQTPLVVAIEGATASPYSHCGLVTRVDGSWQVLEAYNSVELTPLNEFIFRGRSDAFAVYRLNEEHQPSITTMLEHARKMEGKPYDSRYRMDDEKIYCSELIFKAFKAATGEELGELVTLGNLNWQPYKDTIRRYEGGGAIPLERVMITPKHLSRANQLTRVFTFVFVDDHFY